MIVYKNLKEGVEYSISKTACIEKINKNFSPGGSSPNPGHPGPVPLGRGGGGTIIEEDVEIDPIWDPDTETLHFCIESDEADDCSVVLFIEGEENEEEYLILRDVWLIPGNNLFQISLPGCSIKNSPPKDTLIDSIEKVSKLSNIPEKKEYYSKYLNALDKNPLGSLTKLGENIYQKHLEKRVGSIKVSSLPDRIKSSEVNLSISGTYIYDLWEVENGEEKLLGEALRGKLEEINYDLIIVSAPPKTEFKSGCLIIPENKSADVRQIISIKIKIDNFEQPFIIYQDAAKLSYTVSYSTELKKDDLPIFVLGNLEEEINIKINVDPTTLVLQGPSNLGYIDINREYLEGGVKFKIQTNEENPLKTYRPSEPFLCKIYTKNEGITISSFYVVQKSSGTDFPLKILEGDGVTERTSDNISCGSDEIIVAYPGTSATPPRYWKVFSSLSSIAISNGGVNTEWGICYPFIASVFAQKYIYSLSTTIKYTEAPEVIGTVTIWSPLSGNSGGWEDYALSDSKTLNIISEVTEDQISVPNIIDNKLNVTGLGDYEITISTNRTILVDCSTINNWVTIDGFKSIVIRPSSVQEPRTSTHTIRYSGPSPKQAPGIEFGSINIYKGTIANSSQKRVSISVVSLPTNNAINVRTTSGLFSYDSSTYVLPREGGEWKLGFNSYPRINHSDVVIDWDSGKNEQGYYLQYCEKTTEEYTGSSSANDIFVFDPTYYNSTEKVLSSPIYVIQAGYEPAFKWTRTGEAFVGETTYYITSREFYNNGNIYYNYVDDNRNKRIQIVFYSRYNINANWILKNSEGTIINSGNGGEYRLTRGIRSNGVYSYTLEIPPFTLGGEDEDRNTFIGSFEGSSTQMIRPNLSLTTKEIKINLWGGTKKPTLLEDEFEYYYGDVLPIKIANVSSQGNLNFNSFHVVNSNPNYYTGYAIKADSSSIKVENGIATFNIITTLVNDNTARPDISDGTWKFFYDDQVILNPSTGTITRNIRPNAESVYSYPERVQIECSYSYREEGNPADVTGVETLVFTLNKKSYRGHFIFDGIAQEPNVLYNAGNVYYTDTNKELEYRVCSYDSEENNTTTGLREYYMNFDANFTRESVLIINTIEHGKLHQPVKVAQGAYIPDWNFPSLDTIIVGPDRDMILIAEVEGAVNVYSNYLKFIESGSNRDVTDEFYVEKNQSTITIHKFIEPNRGAFKSNTYDIYIMGDDENSAGTFTIEQDGIEFSFSDGEGNPITFFGSSVNPLKVNYRVYSDNNPRYKFYITATRHQKNGDVIINNENIEVDYFEWESDSYDNLTQVFNYYRSIIAYDESINKHYIDHVFESKEAYYSQEIPIVATIGLDIKEEENNIVNSIYTEELTFYLEKQSNIN